MIELTTIRVTEGYYEVVSCSEEELNELEEGLREKLRDYCDTRGRDIEVVKFFILRDRDGNIKKVWSLEVFYGPFGAMIYLDNPWV